MTGFLKALVVGLGLVVAGIGLGGQAFSGAGKASGAGSVSNAPVVAELFTSQGCSSCPPADAVAGRLAREPGIIMITRPVTYWDRLGWKDTLAREANTQLQRAYARRGGANSGVYTPQMVINGRALTIGSREAEIRKLIAGQRSKSIAGKATVPQLALIAGQGGNTTVHLTGEPPQPARVYLLALSRDEHVRIGSGENGGRTMTYSNVVIDERLIGDWQGGNARIAVPASALRVAGADRYAVVLRIGSAGPILAARYL